MITHYLLTQGCKVFIGVVISDTDIKYHGIICEGGSQVSANEMGATDVQQWLEGRFSYVRLKTEVQMEVGPFRQC